MTGSHAGALRILLASRDATLQALLLEQFHAYGDHELAVSATGTGLAATAEQRCDLVLVDDDLDDMNGSELCRELRRREIPVIALVGSEVDARGMRAHGAADAVVKPFRFDDLDARIEDLLAADTRGAIRIGDYSFAPGLKALFAIGSGKRVPLTEKETRILHYLYRARGEPVSRETLLAEIWEHTAQLETHTLETHIYRLRRKIEANPDRPKVLVTGPGGYSLVP